MTTTLILTQLALTTAAGILRGMSCHNEKKNAAWRWDWKATFATLLVATIQCQYAVAEGGVTLWFLLSGVGIPVYMIVFIATLVILHDNDQDGWRKKLKRWQEKAATFGKSLLPPTPVPVPVRR